MLHSAFRFLLASLITAACLAALGAASGPSWEIGGTLRWPGLGPEGLAAELAQASWEGYLKARSGDAGFWARWTAAGAPERWQLSLPWLRLGHGLPPPWLAALCDPGPLLQGLLDSGGSELGAAQPNGLGRPGGASDSLGFRGLALEPLPGLSLALGEAAGGWRQAGLAYGAGLDLDPAWRLAWWGAVSLEHAGQASGQPDLGDAWWLDEPLASPRALSHYQGGLVSQWWLGKGGQTPVCGLQALVQLCLAEAFEGGVQLSLLAWLAGPAGKFWVEGRLSGLEWRDGQGQAARELEQVAAGLDWRILPGFGAEARIKADWLRPEWPQLQAAWQRLKLQGNAALRLGDDACGLAALLAWTAQRDLDLAWSGRWEGGLGLKLGHETRTWRAQGRLEPRVLWAEGQNPGLDIGASLAVGLGRLEEGRLGLDLEGRYVPVPDGADRVEPSLAARLHLAWELAGPVLDGGLVRIRLGLGLPPDYRPHTPPERLAASLDFSLGRRAE